MMRPPRLPLKFSVLFAAPLAAACGSTASGRITATHAPSRTRWTAFTHAQRPLDVVGPRADGSLVLAAAGQAWTVGRAGQVRPLGSGKARYTSPGGEEPYIALSPGGCYGTGTVYALRLVHGRGVVAIDSSGRAHRFATLSAPGLIDGIAFDRTGAFSHRLLVTVNAGARTTVDAISCPGTVATITRDAPRVEGGIAVAPATFGRFAGDLIAPGEASGLIFAITPTGRSELVARSGLPHGNDIGVESEGFVPPGQADAFVADRLTPGNPHPGDDVVLRMTSAALRGAGVRSGDLLVATEGGALTDAVTCGARTCTVRYVANGPAAAHVEGHIAFVATG